MVSIPPKMWGLVEKEYPKIRVLVYKVLKEVGFYGGSMIFHPFRLSDLGVWYFSPHFHVVGYGWINGEKVSKVYEKREIVIKNLGLRKNVGATALYQLSHAGVNGKYHTITWFGCLAYNKFSFIDIEVEERCPLCGAELKRVIWVGEGDNPLEGFEEGGYWIDPGGWVYRARRFGG